MTVCERWGGGVIALLFLAACGGGVGNGSPAFSHPDEADGPGTHATVRTAAKNDKVRGGRKLAPALHLIGAEDLPAAAAGGGTGEGITVALLDTGVLSGHPYLTGRVSGELCFARVCPPGPNQAPPWAFHGTEMAGIIAGAELPSPSLRGESSRLRGVAPKANILAIQVFDLAADASNCQGREPCIVSYESSQIAALDYLVRNSDRIKNLGVVNLSFGNSEHHNTPCANDRRAPYIDALTAKGIAVVAAAGNDYGDSLGVGSPACIESTIAVAATGFRNIKEEVPTKLQNGILTDLLAPGVLVTSSKSIAQTGEGVFAQVTGNSVAAAQVSGAIAALQSLACAPSTAQVIRALVTSGIPVHDDRDGTDLVKPRIDLREALKKLPRECSRPDGRTAN